MGNRRGGGGGGGESEREIENEGEVRGMVKEDEEEMRREE